MSGPAKDESERRSAALRTTDQLRKLTSQALTSDAVKAAFATKLVAAGLGLVACAAGVDYFVGGADMQRAFEQVASEAGATGVASTVHVGGAWLSAAKAWAVAQLPDTPREVGVWLATVGGLVLLAWGLHLKVRAPDRGRAVRDLGWVILGPGLLGCALFAISSWHGVAAIRVPMRGFWDKVRGGQLDRAAVGEFTLRYGPWVWHSIGPLLVLAIGLAVAAIALRPRPDERATLRVGKDVGRRTAAWASGLLLAYYLCVTVVTVSTYGAGLPALTWPWKVRPLASLGTLLFMAVGGGLVRTGRVLLRENAALGPAQAEDPSRAG